MSMQGYDSGFNPFLWASKKLASSRKSHADGAALSAHTDHANLLHSNAMALQAQSHKNIMQTLKTTAKIQKNWVSDTNSLANPGTAVSVSHGNTSASFTKNHPVIAEPAAKAPTGRVPVKRPRGGAK